MTVTLPEAGAAPVEPRSNLVEVEDLKVHFPIRAGIFKTQVGTVKAVSDISFALVHGGTIAFVGPSGSGKTTLVKLIVGLYRPASGRILYDGHAHDVVDLPSLRARIGLVTQDTQLFSGTIRENLLFVRPGANRTAESERKWRGADTLTIPVQAVRYAGRMNQSFIAHTLASVTIGQPVKFENLVMFPLLEHRPEPDAEESRKRRRIKSNGVAQDPRSACANRGESRIPDWYTVLDDAITGGFVEITEVSDQGSVSAMAWRLRANGWGPSGRR